MLAHFLALSVGISLFFFEQGRAAADPTVLRTEQTTLNSIARCAYKKHEFQPFVSLLMLHKMLPSMQIMSAILKMLVM